MNEITQSEKSRLKQLERVIKAGEKTFVEVGLALTEIRDSKLYREEHGSFEKYMDRVWGWTKQYGYQLMAASKVVNEITNNKNLSPELVKRVNSSLPFPAARALSKVPPPRRLGVVQKIVAAGQKVTAAAVSKIAGKPPKRPATALLDGTGLPVPPEVSALWNRMAEAQALMTSISSVRGVLRKAEDEKDILFIEVDFTDCMAKLNQVYIDVQRAKPFAICPTCSGIHTKGCMTCKGRGFVSEFYWKHQVPEETKTLTGRK